MDVYRGHYGAGLGNVLAGVARTAIPLVAPFLRRLGTAVVNKGISKLNGALGGPKGIPRRRRAPPPRLATARRVVKRKRAAGTSSQRQRGRTKADIFSGSTA